MERKMTDEDYMRLAIELAKKGTGFTSPNPLVGAVIVKDGRIIGQGYHERYGEPHAERNALAACTEDPKGATIYVTLEPCCHYGKQPPCTEAILESGISKVVIGSFDPNPLVSGKGMEILRQHGIEVQEDFLREECDAINTIFFHYIQRKRPYVVMKYAMTLDGKIACFTGESKWITGEIAREHVQRTRHRLSGIMIGVGTVIADDPMLNVRIEGGHNPTRIICDTHLRTPLDTKIVATAFEIPTIIATCEENEEKKRAYLEKGIKIINLPEKDGEVDLEELMLRLGEEKIDSLLIEGGGTLHWSALKAGIVNKVQAYIAPKLLGGRDAKTPIEGQGVETPDMATFLENCEIIRLGKDYLIEGEVKK